MRKNNFQRLEDEDLERMPDVPLRIASNVHNSLGNMRTMGSMVDLYLTKIIDVFIMMSGGTVERNNNTFSHTSGHGSPTEPDSGIPGGPSEK